MLDECPACGELSAQIQARDEVAAIEAAKDQKLTAACAKCGFRGALPAEVQAAWADRE